MKIVLTGIQGSGKSTQGNMLEKQLKLPYLSTGHIFRQIAKEKTTLGRYIKTVMNAGALIPDEKTIEIVNNYLSRPEYKRGYILDGFPRTIEQAKRFKNNVDKVVYIDIPDKEALWRLAYRNDSDRDDNTIQALRKRIESFHKFTEPVLEFYRKKKKVVEIDGTQSIDEVNDEILKSLGKQLVKDQIENWKQKDKAIIAVVGLPGVGKTDAANYFREKGLPVISFGKIVTDLVQKKYGKQTEEYHKLVRESIRTEHGIEAMAVLNKENIKKALKKENIIIIDGMRSWEEYLYLKKEFKNVRIFILALHADKHVRYHRVSMRKTDRPELYGEERDINELIRINMGPTIAFADFLVKNNFSRTEFYDKLEEAYREVYFS